MMNSDDGSDDISFDFFFLLNQNSGQPTVPAHWVFNKGGVIDHAIASSGDHLVFAVTA